MPNGNQFVTRRNVPRAPGRRQETPFSTKAGGFLKGILSPLPLVGDIFGQQEAKSALEEQRARMEQLEQMLQPMAAGELSPIQQLQEQRYMGQLNQQLRELGQRFSGAAGKRGQAYSPAAAALSQRLQAEASTEALSRIAGLQSAQQMQAANLLAQMQSAGLSRATAESIAASERSMQMWQTMAGLGMDMLLRPEELEEIFGIGVAGGGVTSEGAMIDTAAPFGTVPIG